MPVDAKLSYVEARTAYTDALNAHRALAHRVGVAAQDIANGVGVDVVLRNWPSADDLTESASRLRQAFVDCHAAWVEVTEVDRVHSLKPPKEIGAT